MASFQVSDVAINPIEIAEIAMAVNKLVNRPPLLFPVVSTPENVGASSNESAMAETVGE